MTGLLAVADVFTTTHIGATAAITAAVALVAGIAVTRDRARLADVVLIAVLAGAATFLYRRSANLPQLNKDGLPGFSADDWLAPVVVAVWLLVARPFSRGAGDRGLDRARALAVVAALAVNVIAI